MSADGDALDKREWIAKGTRVCIVGYGGSQPIHEHTTIDRLTKTLAVCKNGRRYRHTEKMLPSVPYFEYSGTYMRPYCQRPKKQEG